MANFQAFQALTPTMVVLSAAIIKKDKTLVARSQRPVWPKLSSWGFATVFCKFSNGNDTKQHETLFLSDKRIEKTQKAIEDR